MIRTVPIIASARNTARPRCSPSWRKVSSGPYALDERPSAPRPTQARNAISDSLWKACGSSTSLGGPKTRRRTLPHKRIAGRDVQLTYHREPGQRCDGGHRDPPCIATCKVALHCAGLARCARSPFGEIVLEREQRGIAGRGQLALLSQCCGER